MVAVGLLKKTEQETYRLTETGFNVAHDLRVQRHQRNYEKNQDKRSHEVNRAIAILTLGLVSVGVVQVGSRAAVEIHSGWWQVYFWVGVGILVVLIMAIRLFQSGMLTSWNKEE